MLQLVATQSSCREQTVYVYPHHGYNTDDLNYVLIRSIHSTALQTPQAGQVMYTTSAGQSKIWPRWEPSPSLSEICIFPWSSLAANFIANADWLTTVIPRRQLTLDKTQSPFVARVTRHWDYGGIPTEQGYAMDSEWTPGAAPATP